MTTSIRRLACSDFKHGILVSHQEFTNHAAVRNNVCHAIPADTWKSFTSLSLLHGQKREEGV